MCWQISSRRPFHFWPARRGQSPRISWLCVLFCTVIIISHAEIPVDRELFLRSAVHAMKIFGANAAGNAAMRIALDAMGGDYAPKNTVEGAVLALKEYPYIEKLF